MPAMYAADVPNRIPDVTYRQLDHWIRLGYVKPVGGPGQGTGVKRIIPANEVRVVRALSRLRAGLVLDQAAQIARFFADPEAPGRVRATIAPGFVVDFDLYGTADITHEENTAA